VRITDDPFDDNVGNSEVESRNLSCVKLTSFFCSTLLGTGEFLSRSENIVHTLGSITSAFINFTKSLSRHFYTLEMFSMKLYLLARFEPGSFVPGLDAMAIKKVIYSRPNKGRVTQNVAQTSFAKTNTYRTFTVKKGKS
jgi:hypothetical protein